MSLQIYITRFKW